MTLRDPGPDTDRIRDQRRAVLLLDTLTTRSIHEDLPPLVWTIGNAGPTLIGRVTRRESTSAQRAAWEAWVTALDAVPWPPRANGRRLRLHAVAQRFDGLAQVILLADIDTFDADMGDDHAHDL